MKILGSTHEIEHVMTLARQNHWGIRVLGQGDVLTQPVFKAGWWYEPLTADSIMPPMAVKRAQAILNSGIRPKGFIIAHQATNLLPGAVEAKPLLDEGKINAIGKALKAVGLGIVATVVTVWLAPMLIGLGMLLALPFLLDPALIMVLEDGTMVEVARWYD